MFGGKQLFQQGSLVFRALERIGNAYDKQNKLEEALYYYQKSSLEFGSEAVTKKANKVPYRLYLCAR